MLTIWRLLLLVTTFALPQLLGLLLYFRLSRFPKWLAHAAGVLAPAALFLFLSPPFFFPELPEAQLKDEVLCALPALAAVLMILLGTAVEVFVALVVQLYMFSRRAI